MYYFFRGLTAPSLPGPPHYLDFTITLRHTTLGRIPLDERSARRRKLYLAKQDTVKKTGIHTAAGFEPAIPASERPKTHVLDCPATGICGNMCIFVIELYLLLYINLTLNCNCDE
jgi:hypothetical protein